MKAMVLRLLACGATAFTSTGLMAQLESVNIPVKSNMVLHEPGQVGRRSASKPTQCNTDTAMFVAYGNKGYRFVTLRSGSSLGQFYGAPQSLTVHGFRLHALANTTSPARPVYIRLRCNLYKAGLDSLPTGSPLASDTVTVDTVMRSTIYLSDIQFDAKFKKAVTLNYAYILAVECDSTNVTASLITNDWTQKDGRRRNLGCGSVSGKWYRNLQLNIGGVLFDADAQLYPFVSYKLGADFSITNQCYNNTDTVRFQNLNKNSVSSSIYYNYYTYANFMQFNHRWSYDNMFSSYYVVDGKYKPTSRKNFDVRLISSVVPYRSSGQCFDTVVKTVYFKPTTPVLKRPATGCKGDTVSIDVSYESGSSLRWYRKITDTAFYTGGSLKIENVQANDTFYIRAENGPCNSGFVKVVLSVNDYPSDPVVKRDSICQGAAANLQATSDKGDVLWYYSGTSGIPFYTGNLLQTDKLFRDTTFYVRVDNQGCLNKGGRIPVTAYVSNNFAPLRPVVVADTFACYQSGASFTFKATGADTIRWFDQPAGGKPVGTGPTYTISPSSRGTYDYYVEVWNGICASSREHSTLHVYQAPAISGAANKSICAGDSVQFSLSVPWGSVKWFDASLTEVYEGTKPVFKNLTYSRSYYLESFEENCKASTRDSVRVTVNNPPVPSLVKADPVCSKGLGTFQVTVGSGKVWWYYEDTSTSSFYQGNTLKTGMLLSNVTYYYATENNGCFSSRKPLTITIKPRPTAGFTWQLRWQNQLICTPLVSSGVTLEWFWGDGGKTTGLPANHTYASSGNYTVRLVVTSNSNGCKDTADIPVPVNHVGRQQLQLPEAVVYPVPAMAGDMLRLADAEGKTVSYVIYGMSGVQVLSGETRNGDIALPASLQPGNYILLTVADGKQYRNLVSIYAP